MDKPLVTVITPVFNEEAVIGRFYEETKKILFTISEDFHTRILFVVDRCTDNTMDRLREIAVRDPDAQILSLSARFGHQMSLLAGIDAASDAAVIVMMDSDLQHPPSLIPELIRQYQLGYDIVYTVRKDTADVSFLRKQVGNIFYGVLGALSKTKINANASDFRLISQRVARLLRNEIRERNLFLRGVFSWLGFNQASVEYIAARREAGSSKYSLSRMINLAVAGILSFSTKPLQLSIFAGVWLAAISFLIGLYTILEYFRQDSIPSGWTTIVTLLVFFNGVQLVFTGILGVYIGGIFEEVKGRPHYIVEEAINIKYEKS